MDVTGKRDNALPRRHLLFASGLAMTAVVAPASAEPAPLRSPPTLLRTVEGVSAKAFGAVGNGQYHALSARFATLIQAREVYPFAMRLDQSLDWAGIQAALNAVEDVGGTATIPVGRYILSDPVRVPSAVTLRGESRTGSILDNQNHRLDAPQIVNKDPVAFLYTTICDLTLNGGTHAISVHVTRESAGVIIERITSNLQTEANIAFSSMQTTVIRDCHLMDGKHGIAVLSFPCNSVHIDNCRLGRHSDASIYLRGVDGLVMRGGSIEGGGTRGRTTIDIDTGGAYARAIQFQNVYFENTHEYLLRSRGTRTIGFDGCKMTGTSAAGELAAYRFDCGDDLIAFGNNQWDRPTVGPTNMLMTGRNDGLGGTATCWSERSGRAATVRSRRFAPDEARQGLFAIDFGNHSGRAWGTLQLFLDMSDELPLRRLVMTVDILVDADRRTSRIQSSDNEARLAITTPNNGRRMKVRLGNQLTGHRQLWFDLTLSAHTSGAMAVDVL